MRVDTTETFIARDRKALCLPRPSPGHCYTPAPCSSKRPPASPSPSIPAPHLPCSFQEFQTFLVAILAGTLFLYTNMHTETINDGLVYLGLLFFCSMTAMWNVFAEMGTMVRRAALVGRGRVLLCRGRACAACSAACPLPAMPLPAAPP